MTTRPEEGRKKKGKKKGMTLKRSRKTPRGGASDDSLARQALAAQEAKIGSLEKDNESLQRALAASELKADQLQGLLEERDAEIARLKEQLAARGVAGRAALDVNYAINCAASSNAWQVDQTTPTDSSSSDSQEAVNVPTRSLSQDLTSKRASIGRGSPIAMENLERRASLGRGRGVPSSSSLPPKTAQESVLNAARQEGAEQVEGEDEKLSMLAVKETTEDEEENTGEGEDEELSYELTLEMDIDAHAAFLIQQEATKDQLAAPGRRLASVINLPEIMKKKDTLCDGPLQQIRQDGAPPKGPAYLFLCDDAIVMALVENEQLGFAGMFAFDPPPLVVDPDPSEHVLELVSGRGSLVVVFEDAIAKGSWHMLVKECIDQFLVDHPEHMVAYTQLGQDQAEPEKDPSPIPGLALGGADAFSSSGSLPAVSKSKQKEPKKQAGPSPRQNTVEAVKSTSPRKKVLFSPRLSSTGDMMKKKKKKKKRRTVVKQTPIVDLPEGVELYLLFHSEEARRVLMINVDVHPDNLFNDGVYVLLSPGMTYVHAFSHVKVKIIETLAHKFASMTDAKVSVPDVIFWSYFGSTGKKAMKPSYSIPSEFRQRVVENTSLWWALNFDRKIVQVVAKSAAGAEDATMCYVVDTQSDVYVWIGSRALQNEAFCCAKAEEVFSSSVQLRPTCASIRVVKEVEAHPSFQFQLFLLTKVKKRPPKQKREKAKHTRRKSWGTLKKKSVGSVAATVGSRPPIVSDNFAETSRGRSRSKTSNALDLYVPDKKETVSQENPSKTRVLSALISPRPQESIRTCHICKTAPPRKPQFCFKCGKMVCAQCGEGKQFVCSNCSDLSAAGEQPKPEISPRTSRMMAFTSPQDQVSFLKQLKHDDLLTQSEYEERIKLIHDAVESPEDKTSNENQSEQLLISQEELTALIETKRKERIEEHEEEMAARRALFKTPERGWYEMKTIRHLAGDFAESPKFNDRRRSAVFSPLKEARVTVDTNDGDDDTEDDPLMLLSFGEALEKLRRELLLEKARVKKERQSRRKSVHQAMKNSISKKDKRALAIPQEEG